MFMFLGFIPKNFLEKQTHKKTQKIQLKNEIINLKVLIFNLNKIIKSPSHKPRKFKTRKSSNPKSHNLHFFNHQTHIETQNPTTTCRIRHEHHYQSLKHHIHAIHLPYPPLIRHTILQQNRQNLRRLATTSTTSSLRTPSLPPQASPPPDSPPL